MGGGFCTEGGLCLLLPLFHYSNQTSRMALRHRQFSLVQNTKHISVWFMEADWGQSITVLSGATVLINTATLQGTKTGASMHFFPFFDEKSIIMSVFSMLAGPALISHVQTRGPGRARPRTFPAELAPVAPSHWPLSVHSDCQANLAALVTLTPAPSAKSSQSNHPFVWVGWRHKCLWCLAWYKCSVFDIQTCYYATISTVE